MDDPDELDDAWFRSQSGLLARTAEAAGVPQKVLGRRVTGLFRRLARHIDATVTIEVGAYEAGFSRWAAEELSARRVVAFEANPYVYEHFRGELAGTGVDYVNSCIGPENGTVTLHIPQDRKGSSKDLVNKIASLSDDHVWTDSYHDVDVPSVRLDDAVALTPEDRVVAWIDVEHALKMVLDGSRSTLARSSVVLVEVENTAVVDGQWIDVDVARWFRRIGLVPLARDAQQPHQYNLLLVAAHLADDPEVLRLAANVFRPFKPGKKQ